MPIIDFHCDTLLKLVKEQRELSLKNNKYSVDINKLQQAGSIAQFFAAFVDLKKTQAPMQKAMQNPMRAKRYYKAVSLYLICFPKAITVTIRAHIIQALDIMLLWSCYWVPQNRLFKAFNWMMQADIACSF